MLRRQNLLLLAAVTLGFPVACPHALAAESPVRPERVSQIAAWLPAAPVAAGQPISHRGWWDALRSQPGWQAVIADAERLSAQPIPPLPDELYLDFSKTGNRTPWQKVAGQRDSRVTTLALAECLENKGRFIQPLSEAVRAQCAEQTWVMPAHDGRLENFNGKLVDMDLRATLVGWELATVNSLLGGTLPADTRALIQQEVRRRILTPFRAVVEGRQSGCSWLKANHNWNAVCLAGVVGTALALEPSAQERAWYAAAAEHYIGNFLSGFTPDGYCSEGVGYWNYGFGRFLMLTETIRQATGGKLDLLARPDAAAPALYAIRSEIINGLYPSISDCHPGSKPDPQLVRYLSERFGLSGGETSSTWGEAGRSLAPTLLFASLTSPLPRVNPPALVKPDPLRTWFRDGGVLICRPQPGAALPFAAVLKGGHNAEHHNHNDVGSFSVVLGPKMVLCDPGSEVYTARTFSSRRYESKVLNSFGHAVPVIAGELQRGGANARGRILREEFSLEGDVLALDLRSAYDVPALSRLERTFTFRRGPAPSLRVADEVAFKEPKKFETALVTWGHWKQTGDHEIEVAEGDRRVQVKIDTGGRAFRVSSEVLDEDVTTETKPTRLAIALKEAVDSAVVALEIRPAKE